MSGTFIACDSLQCGSLFKSFLSAEKAEAWAVKEGWKMENHVSWYCPQCVKTLAEQKAAQGALS